MSDTIKVKQRHSFDVSASYNIAPSHEVLVLNPNPVLMKWSYSPKWKLDMNLIIAEAKHLLKNHHFEALLVHFCCGWLV